MLGRRIVEVLDSLAGHGENANPAVEARIHTEVVRLCETFPIYSLVGAGIERDEVARPLGPAA